MGVGKLGTIFLLLFALYTILVISGVFNFSDQQITITVQNYLNKSLDTPLSLLSLIGSVEVTAILMIFVLSVLKFKKGIVTITMFGLGMVVELIGKFLIFHPDPPNKFFRYDLNIFLPSGLVRTGYSYPSGHSFRTAFLVLIISYLIFTSKSLTKLQKKIFITLSFVILFLMLISRVSLGEHWTTDVIGGSLLGFCFALFSIRAFELKP